MALSLFKRFLGMRKSRKVQLLEKQQELACPEEDPSLNKHELLEVTSMLNQRILKRYKERGLIFEEGFRPIDSLELSKESKLFWQHPSDEGCHIIGLYDPLIRTNMPKVVFDDLGVGVEFGDFEGIGGLQKAVAQQLDNPKQGCQNFLLIPFYLDEPVFKLQNGTQIRLFHENQDVKVVAPKDLEEIAERMISVLRHDDGLAVSYADLDLTSSGDLYLKLSYPLKNDIAKGELQKIAQRALQRCAYHASLCEVKCVPETLFLTDTEVKSLSKETVISIENPMYQKKPLKQQKVKIAPSLKYLP